MNPEYDATADAIYRSQQRKDERRKRAERIAMDEAILREIAAAWPSERGDEWIETKQYMWSNLEIYKKHGEWMVKLFMNYDSVSVLLIFNKNLRGDRVTVMAESMLTDETIDNFVTRARLKIRNSIADIINFV